MPDVPVAPLPTLSDVARQVLAVIGRLAPASFRPDVVAAAFHPPSTPKLWLWQRLRRQPTPINPETALQELEQVGLLCRESYRLIIRDDEVYQYAHQLPVSEQVIQELIRTYEELAHVNEAMTADHRRHLDGERPHLLAILRLCQKRKAWVPIRNIHISLRDYWPACENVADQIEAYEIRVAAAYGLGDQGEIARFSQKLGDAYYAAAAYEKAIACYEQAAAHGTTTGWRGELLFRLGTAQMMHQQYQTALKTLAVARECLGTGG